MSDESFKVEVYLNSGRIVKLEKVTHKEMLDLTCGLDSHTEENRIWVGEWVFDGKAIDAVRVIEEVQDEKV